jgi:hypothetical protein
MQTKLAKPSTRRYVLKPQQQISKLYVLLTDPRSGKEWSFSDPQDLWNFLTSLSSKGLK